MTALCGLKSRTASVDNCDVETEWSERAFNALDRGTGAATVLLTDDFVIRWVSSSWERIFGYDPVGLDGLEMLHPDDLPFAMSVLEHHDVDRALYATPEIVDEVIEPSAELRLRCHGDRWLKCMVRVDNHLNDPDIGALVIHVLRPIDPSGLSVAIDCITRATPVDEALLAILGYMAEDGVRSTHGPSAVVWFDDSGRRIVTTHTEGPSAEVLFGAEATDLPRSTDATTITFVEDMPLGPMRAYAESIGMTCLWSIHIGGPDDDLGVVLSWSRWRYALELRPHMHFSIGCDVVKLALHENRRIAAMRKVATVDALTGVYNRLGLMDAFEMLRADGATRLGAVFIDLDDFKQVNDAHGHAVGDQVLVEVARRLREVVRSADVVARIGGDEFVIVCAGIDVSALHSLSRRVDEVFSREIPTDAGWVSVRASTGTGDIADRLDLTELIRRADDAQYEAKRLAKSSQPHD